MEKSEKTSLSQRLAPLSPGKKIEYIWNYYKGPIFAIVAVLVLLIWAIWKLCNPGKYQIIELTLVNGNLDQEELSLFDPLLEENGYDPAENMIYVNTAYEIDMSDSSQRNVNNYQMLYARFLGNDLDLVISDEVTFAAFANQNAFIEIEPLLTEEQREKYLDKLIFIEDPDTGEKISCGVLLEDTALQEEGIYNEPVIAGIPHVNGDQELALALIFYLLGE